jgi:hypothetical protein
MTTQDPDPDSDDGEDEPDEFYAESDPKGADRIVPAASLRFT